jgi:DNA-binding transcriptional regulator YiaG
MQYCKFLYPKVPYSGRGWSHEHQPMPRSVFTDAYASTIADLVALRKQHGVSQVELAERLGKTQQFVSYVETRRRRIDVVEWVSIVRAIGADPSASLLTVLRSIPENYEI